MININDCVLKKFLIDEMPDKLYNLCKLNNTYDINYDTIFTNIKNKINYLYNYDINFIISETKQMLEKYNLFLIFIGLVLHTASYSINTYMFFFIVNTGIQLSYLDNICYITTLLSILYPPLSVLIYNEYKKKDFRCIPSDVFEMNIFVDDMSYFCILSSVLPETITNKLLGMVIIKILCQTYFGPFCEKMKYNWLKNEKIGHLILGAVYEKNINILQLNKLIFLRKLMNSFFNNLIVYICLVLPFLVPILITFNPYFFNISVFNLFMFHLLIFMGSGINFIGNIIISFSSIFLDINFNYIDALLCYIYIIYNFSKNTKLLQLGWLDTCFYTRYQLVLKLKNNKNVLINCRSSKNEECAKMLYQHRYLRLYDNLNNISASENGQTKDLELLEKINRFSQTLFINREDAKKKCLEFHNKYSQNYKKNEPMCKFIEKLKLTKTPPLVNCFYDNINKDLLLNKYNNNLYYLHELKENEITVSEIHLHIDKGCFLEQFNDFITYNSSIIKEPVNIIKKISS